MPIVTRDVDGALKDFGSQATGDAYADLGTRWLVSAFGQKTIFIRETGGANAAHYRVVGSLDGTSFTEIISQQSLPPGKEDVLVITDFWRDLKVQVRSATSGASAVVVAHGGGLQG